MRNFKVTVNGTSYDVTIEEVNGVFVAPAATPAPAAAPAPATVVGGTEIKAPFPGTVLRVNVKVGDSVKKGDVLCVIEAMKMENDVSAPADGTVAAVAVQNGKSVTTDELLVTIG